LQETQASVVENEIAVKELEFHEWEEKAAGTVQFLAKTSVPFA
jgi:hypothetical protein